MSRARRPLLPDVLAAGLRLPPRVCVVAPGPNGRAAYGRIPRDACVLAVSKAALIPEVRADLWMMTHSHQDWYAAAHAAFAGLRVYSNQAARRARPSLAGRQECHGFRLTQDQLDPEVMKPIDGLIRRGATVSGCAVQLAYNLGAREILLCGVDMSGDAYFDGSVNRERQHGDTWIAAARFNVMIRWLRARGIAVATLSPTRLEVPAWEPPSTRS